MLAVSWLHFLANLLIAGFLLRMIETKYPDSALGKALMYVY